MKKLLLLLVFSASLFASAQTVSVYEFSSTVSRSFTHVTTEDPIDLTGYERSEVTSITFNSDGVSSVNGQPFSPIASFGSDYLQNLIAYTGGFWYQRNAAIFERVESPITDDPLAAFAGSGWTDDDGDGAFVRTLCGSSFVASYRTTSESQQYVLVRFGGGYFTMNFPTAEALMSYVSTHNFVCELTTSYDNDWVLNSDGTGSATFIKPNGTVYHATQRPEGGGFIRWGRGNAELELLRDVGNNQDWFDEYDIAHDAVIEHNPPN